MKKKIFASVLAVMMILGTVVVFPAFADDAIVIGAADVTVPAGTTEADVTVSVSNVPAGGLSSICFKVKVEGASIKSGEGKTNDYSVVGPTDASAEKGVNFMWVDISEGIKADTDLATFKVALPSDAACGSEYAVVITLSDDAQNYTALDGVTDVAATAKNAKITVVHSLTHVAAADATCTEAGNTEYWSCEGCGKYFSDAEGKTAIDAESVVVAAGHKLTHVEGKEATAEAEGNIEYWKCDACGKYFSDAEGKTEIDAASVAVKYAPKFTPGDVNGDGSINARDVILVMKAALPGFKAPAEYIFEAADMDGNGTINARDIIAVMKAVLSAGKK